MGSFFKNIHPLLRRTRKSMGENDTNYAVLNAINTVLEEVEEETFKSKIQSSLKTATGFYLDNYGKWFGIYRRRESETDSVYRERIIEALDIPRGTNNSIKAAVRRYLEDNTVGIEVYEPWKDIFTYNQSKYDGEHSIQGKYYHFAVIDVFIGSPFGEEIVSVLNDYKPAGVTLHTTYDASIAPRDPSELVDWGSVPYTSLDSYQYEPNLLTLNSLKQPLRGSILLSDVKALNNIFNFNRSRYESLDVYSGNYSVHNSIVHLASTGREFNPTNNTLMDNVVKDTKKLPNTFYKDRDKLNDDYFPLQLRPTDYFYVTMNLDTLFNLRHPELQRFEGEYAKALENSSLQMSFNTERGITLRLQSYNFNSQEWVTLDSVLTGNRTSMFKATLKNAKPYLSENQLLFLRVEVPKDITLSINHFHMDYKSNVRENELGYGLGVLTSDPIFS